MKWSLSQLRAYREEPLQIDEQLDLKHSLMERYPEIIDVAPVQVKGILTYDKGSVLIYGRVKTTLTMPSSRSLTPTALPMDFEIAEYYVPEDSDLGRFDEDDTVIILKDDVINFDVAVEDNILINIPMQILAPTETDEAEMPSGKGWEVVSEAKLAAAEESQQTVDPRLAKLKDLFPDQEAKD